MNGDEETAFQTFIRGLLALIAGASTCAALSYPLRTFRSTATFLVTPTALRVIETGIRAPLNTQWSVADILSIAPLPNPARSALQLTFSASPPLLLLPNRPRAHIDFIVTLLTTTLNPRSTINIEAPPSPAPPNPFTTPPPNPPRPDRRRLGPP
jgi:hypothetical protein